MITTRTYVQRLESHLLGLGLFAAVNGHEPKNPPQAVGITAAVWVQDLGPTGVSTGLASTSAVMTFMVRLYQDMLAEPADEIDPGLYDAVDAVFALVSADFTLGDAVDFVDLLGQTGTAMTARAGYGSLGQTMFRIVDITIPVVVGDAWAQAR